MIVKCKVVASSQAECMWRRLQVHEQQAERQKKNVVQKVMTFATRARDLMIQEGVFVSASFALGK